MFSLGRMQDLSYLHDKKFAVIMVEDDGSEAGDWVVFSGVAKWRDGELFVHRGMDVPEFPVPESAFHRIKPVSAEVKHILQDADYSVTCLVGPIPPDVDPATFLHTGVRWPDSE